MTAETNRRYEPVFGSGPVPGVNPELRAHIVRLMEQLSDALNHIDPAIWRGQIEDATRAILLMTRLDDEPAPSPMKYRIRQDFGDDLEITITVDGSVQGKLVLSPQLATTFIWGLSLAGVHPA